MPSHAVSIGSALFKVVPRNVIVLPILFERSQGGDRTVVC
jgi:hypothetical protein